MNELVDRDMNTNVYISMKYSGYADVYIRRRFATNQALSEFLLHVDRQAIVNEILQLELIPH